VSSRAELIDRYRSGADVLEAAVAGVGEPELDHRPADGGWTAREVVHHCADSEMTSAIRLRKLLAEENAELQGYDQEEFARRLHYGERAIEPSLRAVRAARDTTASLLGHLSEADWQRAGTHTESGRYSVQDWLRIYAAHCHDHAEQIGRALTEARAAV